MTPMPEPGLHCCLHKNQKTNRILAARKLLYLSFVLLYFVPGCTAGRYTSRETVNTSRKPVSIDISKERMRGVASFYEKGFVKKKTSNGEIYDPRKLTAAHPTLPFNTVLKITNLKNKRQVVVRINDRMPYRPDRIIDLSTKAAEELDMVNDGITEVTLEILEEEEQK